MAVDQHYENFPVASFLIPPRMRPFVVAVYRFARYADDVADEGDASPEERIKVLDALDRDVRTLFQGERPLAPTVIGLLALRDAKLPGVSADLFHSLLSAFRQDTHTHRYETYDQLLDYCSRSANPVGRIMLALVGVQHPLALRQSDAICSALQLINFWQDAGLDASRGRIYVPLEDFKSHGVSIDRFPTHAEHQALMRFQCERAAALMRSGVGLLHHLSGRFRLEIAFTIAGGLRILEKISANGFDARLRPQLRWYDLPRLIYLATRAWLDARPPTP
jgi:squalene synthase HpnC